MIVYGQTPKSKNVANLPPGCRWSKPGILRSQPARLLLESTAHVETEPLRRGRPVGDASGGECRDPATGQPPAAARPPRPPSRHGGRPAGRHDRRRDGGHPRWPHRQRHGERTGTRLGPRTGHDRPDPLRRLHRPARHRGQAGLDDDDAEHRRRRRDRCGQAGVPRRARKRARPRHDRSRFRPDHDETGARRHHRLQPQAGHAQGVARAGLHRRRAHPGHRHPSRPERAHLAWPRFAQPARHQAAPVSTHRVRHQGIQGGRIPQVAHGRDRRHPPNPRRRAALQRQLGLPPSQRRHLQASGLQPVARLPPVRAEKRANGYHRAGQRVDGRQGGATRR